MTRHISLIHDSYPGVPGLDTTLARALLRSVSAGEVAETFRIYSPGRVLAFGKRDAVGPGFDDAVKEAALRGFTPLVRLAGGRAAVFHEHTLGFGWTMPIDDPREGIQKRFEDLADLMVKAFARAGVAAEIGEVPGEYCPGRFSVHDAAGRKVMGVGQRLAKRAAHVGGVIVIADADRINTVLEPVYAALQIEFDPGVTGALRDTAPDVTATSMTKAIVGELSALGKVVEDTLRLDTIRQATELLPDHLVASNPQ